MSFARLFYCSLFPLLFPRRHISPYHQENWSWVCTWVPFPLALGCPSTHMTLSGHPEKLSTLLCPADILVTNSSPCWYLVQNPQSLPQNSIVTGALTTRCSNYQGKHFAFSSVTCQTLNDTLYRAYDIEPIFLYQSEVKLTSNLPSYSQHLDTIEGTSKEPQAGGLQGDHGNQQAPGLPFCSGT